MRFLLTPTLLLALSLLLPHAANGEEEPAIPEAPEAGASTAIDRVAERQAAEYARMEGTIIIRGEVLDAAGEPIDDVNVRVIRHTVEHPHGAPEEEDVIDHRFVMRFDNVISVYLQFTHGDHLISELEAFRALPEYSGLPQETPQDFTTTVQLELVQDTVELPEILLLASHLPDGSHFIHGIDIGENQNGDQLPVFQSQKVSAEIHNLYPPFLAAGLERTEEELEPLRDARGRVLSPPNAVGQLHLDDGQGGGFLFFEPDDQRLSRHQVMRRMTRAPQSGYEPTITFLAENYAYTDAMAPIYVWAKLLDYYAKGTVERVYYGPEGFHVLLRLRIQPDGTRHLATRN